MLTEDLNYNLDTELIAQVPKQNRSQSRLLVLDRASGNIGDYHFPQIIEYLRSGDCLVLNDTRVIPARFYAQRQSGAKLEGLFLREKQPGRWIVLLKNAQRLKNGEPLMLTNQNEQAIFQAKANSLKEPGQWELEFDQDLAAQEILEKVGYAPLPPYIRRERHDNRKDEDLTRYQTVYAHNGNAVAAPTAGLHFTDDLLVKLDKKGVKTAFVRLDVGMGTFKPVTAERLEEHPMHWESFEVTEQAADTINQAKQHGRRIIAVGTTSVRVLETVGRDGQVKAARGETKLFIMPGFQFGIIDGLVTNFHLPKSTLIALVAAFADLKTIHKAYQHAMDKRYRFYSYGDAMLIL